MSAAPIEEGRGTFGDALEEIKLGRRCQRTGWNGKGMWIALTDGSEFPITSAPDRAAPRGFTGAARHLVDEMRASQAAHDTVPDLILRICPHVDFRAADGSLVIGWLASQTDMLATDWRVL